MVGTLLGWSPGSGLGDFSGADRVVFKMWSGQLMEATAGGPGGPEQSVGQHGHQGQGTQAEDGGSCCSCLDLEEQQGVDGQCWGRKCLSLFSQQTFALQAMGELSKEGEGHSKLTNRVDTWMNSSGSLSTHTRLPESLYVALRESQLLLPSVCWSEQDGW